VLLAPPPDTDTFCEPAYPRPKAVARIADIALDFADVGSHEP
jgi:hypothetical protein